MAARKIRTTLNDKWRDSIRTSMLLKQLQDQAFDKREMSDKAIKSTEILLRKTMPDLKAVEHSGDVALQVTAIERIIVRC